MRVLHAAMVGLVQIMDYHSFAHARLDIPVTAAKRKVNSIFELDAFFPFSISIALPERIFLNCVLCHITNSTRTC